MYKENEAAGAIDLDWETKSHTRKFGGQSTSWLKVKLGQMHCVQEVLRYMKEKKLQMTWTCLSNGCTCEGHKDCSIFILTVYKEVAAPDNVPSVPGCKYGDTVKLERIPNDAKDYFSVYELAIVARQGEMIYS